MKIVFVGSLVLVVAIMLARPLHMNLLGASLIVVLGFLFVTVSSRLTGEIGSSSNPISGMTVATLLLTCLVFLLVGWTGPTYYVTALSVGAIVCIASSNGGTTSQDLKTGFLVGATPRNQQIAILVGALVSALVLGPILLKLNDAATVYVPRVSKEPLAGERRHALRDVENFPATLRVDPATLTTSETYEGTDIWSGTSSRPTTARQASIWSTPSGTPVYLVDPGINGTHRYHARRRAAGHEVRRAEGDADVLHHQRHPQPPAAVGARAARRDDRGRARDVRHAVAGVRGRRLSAAVVVEPDLHRRHGALAGRPVRRRKHRGRQL